jgi:hypothetical protein
MIWTAWNNGARHSTGAGYGLKVDPLDRDREFRRTWQHATIQLPSKTGMIEVEVNVAKKSFWSTRCRELISKDLGRWLLDEDYAPWPDGTPPKFEVERIGGRRFRVRRLVLDTVR